MATRPSLDAREGRRSQRTSTLLSQVVEQIADVVLLTDQQGFIQYVNPAFETMTGFSADDVRGKTRRILKSGLQEPALYHVEETITPITDETGNASHFVAVMQDIAEALNRQEREVQLRLETARSREPKAPSAIWYSPQSGSQPARRGSVPRGCGLFVATNHRKT
jgi:transcriptional regulator with PAS, ATPase and Fis domain